VHTKEGTNMKQGNNAGLYNIQLTGRSGTVCKAANRHMV